MKVRPRRKGILIRPDTKAVDEKIGSIYIPQKQWSMHPDNIIATVLSIGEDCREIKEGMRIMIGRFAGVKFDLNGEEIMLVDEEDIIAEVTDEV